MLLLPVYIISYNALIASFFFLFDSLVCGYAEFIRPYIYVWLLRVGSNRTTYAEIFMVETLPHQNAVGMLRKIILESYKQTNILRIHKLLIKNELSYFFSDTCEYWKIRRSTIQSLNNSFLKHYSVKTIFRRKEKRRETFLNLILVGGPILSKIDHF